MNPTPPRNNKEQAYKDVRSRPKEGREGRRGRKKEKRKKKKVLHIYHPCLALGNESVTEELEEFSMSELDCGEHTRLQFLDKTTQENEIKNA